MKYKAAIFDMDGTVLNTLEDLTDAVNYAMKEAGHFSGYTVRQVSSFFGSGVEVAMVRAQALEKGILSEEKLEIVGTEGHRTIAGVDEAETQRLIRIYKPYYNAHCRDKTGPYPGIPELLDQLRRAGVVCAVVSNKPDEAVQPLAEECFPGMFDFVLGEKPDLARKPARDMCDYVLKELGIAAEDAVYIGDSEIDLQTAENGGMDCISVTWGFRSAEFLRKHQAELIAEKAEDIAKIILH